MDTYSPANLSYPAPPWYVVVVTWQSGRTVRQTTDCPRTVDSLIAIYRKSEYLGRIEVATTYQEPPEETAKREAWTRYMVDAVQPAPE